MIHGNQQAVDILQRYVTSYIQAAGKARPSFFILSGPTHLGKTTAALHIIKQLLGSTITNDFLHIQDFSNILGKKHELKVKKPEKNPFLELPDGTSYEDKGMRDISARLQQSYVGTAKIVLLENIERMTLEAANAFLKISEEPLTNRIIIATTSHISQVVDTIVSRAIVIPFYPLTDDQILTFLQDKQIFTSTQEQDIAISRALGRPGILMQLHEYQQNNEDS
jgi:DNA polymerase III delta prime subunit